MKIYVVIDTNVLVSAMLAVRPDSATVRVLEHLVNGDIVPMFNAEIVAEYREVLRRPRFRFGIGQGREGCGLLRGGDVPGGFVSRNR